MAARIALIRHGQTEWSESGQHTSVTDIDLTAEGERQANVVPRLLAGLQLAPVTVFSSPRLRARRTAELAGLPVTEVCEDLAEWNYGRYEGLTRAQIRAQDPDWTIWSAGAPEGESPAQVSDRADRMLARARDALDLGDVALVCHGHLSRVLAARWAELPISAGANLAMSPAALTVLSTDRGVPMIEHANIVPFRTGGPADVT